MVADRGIAQDAIAAGLADAQRGMAQALDAKQEWALHAKTVLRQLCRTGRPFTSEDLTDVVGLPTGTTATNRNNAVGAIINAYAKTGMIMRVGDRPARNRSSHGHRIAVWQGFKVWEQESDTP